MWKIILFLLPLNILLLIIAYIYLFNVYKDTEKDPSKTKFGFGEKENFFKATNRIPGLQFGNDCYYYQDLIMEPKIQKLEDFFEFNIESIHNGSIILFIFLFYFALVLSIASLNILTLGLAFIFPNFSKIIPLCVKTLFLLKSFERCSGCVNVIAFIYTVRSYFSSDINSYCDFLSCDNVNIEGFKKYKSVENLKYDFIHFMVFYIACMAFSIIYVPVIINME